MNNNDHAIDPVTLAILKGRFEQIADEMDATLFRSAFNPIIAEAHDASHGIYDALTGETLVQGNSGLPIFVGVMAFGVKTIIDKLNQIGEKPQDGDIWIFNDPYKGGTKPLKGDMDYYYDADPEIQKSEEKIQYYKTIVDTLTEIIDNLKWRHQTISNIIRWKQFQSGN